jgi:hypothetical protein
MTGHQGSLLACEHAARTALCMCDWLVLQLLNMSQLAIPKAAALNDAFSPTLNAFSAPCHEHQVLCRISGPVPAGHMLLACPELLAPSANS